jgi:AcrR family transcriptional regulator
LGIGERVMGLRERKKLATRHQLSAAALRLALDRGFANVLVQDIAAAAGVSPRTFNNYFSSKQEAICAVAVARAERIGAALRERPAHEPLWEAIIEAVAAQYEQAERLDEGWITGIRLVTSTPEIRGEYLKAQAGIEAALAKAIADRTETHLERDLYPRLVAAAVASSSQVAVDHWLNRKPRARLTVLIRNALRQLAHGLPVPTHKALRSHPARRSRNRGANSRRGIS